MGMVILDGNRDDGSCPALDILLRELRSRGADVQVFRLREFKKMGSCIGCFRCWLKTPGECVETDEGRHIAEAVLQSDTVILLSPVTFGGYSSEIKKVQDRWIPLILPDFGIFHGEVHHLPRYQRYPRWIGIGIQAQPNEEEAHLFRVLVGRNALNFHAPSYAAAVFPASESEVSLREQIQALLEREDDWPLGRTITSLMPGPVAPEERGTMVSNGAGRALLMIGSPKVGSPSTSGVLGGRILKQLEGHGWETSTLTLRRNLLKKDGQADLVAEVNRADLIVLAFPLYIDSLPFLLMKALEIVAGQLSGRTGEPSKRIVAVVNNGFADVWQNALALAICRRFALTTGLSWEGALALGAGEALFRGQPFEETNRNSPPVDHVEKALDLTGAALAAGNPVPSEAMRLIRKTPIPFLPFRLWRRLFIRLANQHWRRTAADYEIDSEALLAQPYGGVPGGTRVPR